MEETYRAGKVRALGLSNFPQDKIAEVIEVADIKPQLVTVECHPYHAQRDLRAYLAPRHGDRGVVPARPRRQRSSGGPVFVTLAEKYGKTPAGVIMRWHVQMGTSIIPGSRTPPTSPTTRTSSTSPSPKTRMAEIAKLDGTMTYYTATEEALAGYLQPIRPDFDAQE